MWISYQPCLAYPLTNSNSSWIASYGRSSILCETSRKQVWTVRKLRNPHTFVLTDTGEIVCLEVVNNFASSTDIAVSSAFFQQYFLSIVQDIFFVLTDADHKSGFKLQSALLARMFKLVETNHIQAPLYDPSQVPDANISNAMFLREFCANLLKTAFPHVQLYVLRLL